MNRTIDNNNDTSTSKLDHPVQSKKSIFNSTETNDDDNNDANNNNNKTRDPNFLKCENIVSTPSLRQRIKMKGIIS